MEGYFILLTMFYDNGDIQTWGYDGSQFDTMQQLKSNMIKDFKAPRYDRSEVVVKATGFDNIRSPFKIPVGEIKGKKFVDLIFNEIKERSNGN